MSVKRKFSKIIANRKKRVFGHIYGPYLFHVVWKNTKETGRGCLEGWVDVQLHHKFSQFSKRFIYLYFCPDNVWPFWTYLFYRNQTYTVASVPAVTGSVYLPGFRFFLGQCATSSTQRISEPYCAKIHKINNYLIEYLLFYYYIQTI